MYTCIKVKSSKTNQKIKSYTHLQRSQKAWNILEKENFHISFSYQFGNGIPLIFYTSNFWPQRTVVRRFELHIRHDYRVPVIFVKNYKKINTTPHSKNPHTKQTNKKLRKTRIISFCNKKHVVAVEKYLFLKLGITKKLMTNSNRNLINLALGE